MNIATKQSETSDKGNSEQKQTLTNCSNNQENAENVTSKTVSTPKAFTQFDSLDQFKEYIRDMFVNGSQIDRELFSACTEFHSDIEVTSWGDVETPIHDLMNWGSYKRFRQQANDNFYACFLLNEDGSIWQAIISCDPDKGKDGKPYRYLAPTPIEKGNGDQIFTPPVPPSIRQKIGSRYGVRVPSEGSFWEWKKTQRDIPYIDTEGAKKSLRALSDGYVALAFYGCTCGTEPALDSSPWQYEEWELKDALKNIVTPGSINIIAFDQDIKESASIAVKRGKAKLREAFSNASSYCVDMNWKPEEGKGLDDITRDVFERSYKAALASWEKQLSKSPSDFGGKSKLKTANEYAQMMSEGFREKTPTLWNDEHQCWRIYNDNKGIWETAKDNKISEKVLVILRSKTNGKFGKKLVDDIRGLIKYELITHEWGERENILPFSDGVLEIASGKFEEHSPSNRLTWTLPRKYNTPPTGDWETIRNWLHEAWSKEDVEKLLCFAAAVIRGKWKLQTFLYLVGSGGSGKGTYCRLLTSLLGDRNVWSGRIEQLADKNDVIGLIGKPLALFPDQDKVTGSLQPFKNITGGDIVRGNQKYKDSISFQYHGMAVVTSNQPVLLGGAAAWLKRRALVINCNYQPKVQRDLDAEFEKELSAFTKYLLTISDERIVKAFSGQISKGIDAASWSMMARQDSIAAWVEEHIIFDPSAHTPIGSNKDEWKDFSYNPAESTLFGSYHLYCRESGMHGKGKTNFTPEFEELCQKVLDKPFVKRDRIGAERVRVIRGVKLRRFSTGDLTTSEVLNGCTPHQPGDQSSDQFDQRGDQKGDQRETNPEPLLCKHPTNVPKDSPKTFYKSEKNQQLSLLSPEKHESIANEKSLSEVGQVGQVGRPLVKPLHREDSSLTNPPLVTSGRPLVTPPEQQQPQPQPQQQLGIQVGDKVRMIPPGECSTIAHQRMYPQYGGLELVVYEVKGDKVTCTKLDGYFTTWFDADLLEPSPT